LWVKGKPIAGPLYTHPPQRTEQEKHWDVLAEKQAAAFEHDGRVLFQDATVRAVDKVIAEFEAQPERDYERGFIDGMQKQAQSSVDKAVNAMAQRTWVGLTDEEQRNIAYSDINCWDWGELMDATEAKLKEKNT
jgi:hypothetical protein